MNCMKCGRDIPAEQVFCDNCLEIMKKYPVKPDTVVQLPRSRQQIAQKKQSARRRPLSPEEQIPVLKKSLRRHKLCIAILSLIIVAAAVFAFLQVQQLTSLPELPHYTNSTPDTTGET